MKKRLHEAVRTLTLLMLYSIVNTSLALPDVLTVPDPYPTIQEAIDAADEGDEIIVFPGTYVENINFNGKNIILHSTNPTSRTIVETTVIDGNEQDSVVTFSGDEGTTCVLAGFTIQDGFKLAEGDYPPLYIWGGGITGNGTRATIEYNVVTSNSTFIIPVSSAEGGGGIANCDGVIRHCTISHNSSSGTTAGGTDDWIYNAGGGGGLLDCDGIIECNSIVDNEANYGGGLIACNGIIQNNVIAYNHASHFYAEMPHTHEEIPVGGIGGGIDYCEGIIRNNTIFGNSASLSGGGLSRCDNAIINCIIWGNSAPENSQIENSSTPSYSCIQDWEIGGVGNINLQPSLVDPENNDFHLSDASSCIDAGEEIPGLTDDFEGDSRPYDSIDTPRGDGSDFDIGADEFIPEKTGACYWVTYE